MSSATPDSNGNLDLVLERVIDVPRELVWEAWTKPEHLSKWFTPRPWTVSDCEIDLRPGGIFRTVMRSPEGQEFPNLGCYLEVVPNERLVWTDALLPGYRPASQPTHCMGGDEPMFMTCVLTLEPHGTGTRYVATALHGTAASRQRHEEMGFHDGWSAALEQMIEHIKSM
jgi:uncharacterized protein YndB with AHSA1/START domain